MKALHAGSPKANGVSGASHEGAMKVARVGIDASGKLNLVNPDGARCIRTPAQGNEQT
jgi:hypothetical protein